MAASGGLALDLLENASIATLREALKAAQQALRNTPASRGDGQQLRDEAIGPTREQEQGGAAAAATTTSGGGFLLFSEEQSSCERCSSEKKSCAPAPKRSRRTRVRRGLVAGARQGSDSASTRRALHRCIPACLTSPLPLSPLPSEAERREDTDWMEVTDGLQRRVLREAGVPPLQARPSMPVEPAPADMLACLPPVMPCLARPGSALRSTLHRPGSAPTLAAGGAGAAGV